MYILSHKYILTNRYSSHFFFMLSYVCYNVLTLGKDSSDRGCYDNYKDYTADQDHYLLLQRAKSQKRGGISEK